MNNTNLIQATPETASMRDAGYEAPVESRGRKVLRVSGAVLAALVSIGTAASAVMAKTLAGVVQDDPFSPDMGKLMHIGAGGQVNQFDSGGHNPQGVAFGGDVLLVVHDNEGNLVGFNEAGGQLFEKFPGQPMGALAHDSISGVTVVSQQGASEYGWDGFLHFYFPDGSQQDLNVAQTDLMGAKFINGDLFVLSYDGIRKFSQTSLNHFEQILFDGNIQGGVFDYNPSMNALVVSFAYGIGFYDADTLQEIPGSEISDEDSGSSGNGCFCINPLDHNQLWIEGGNDLEIKIVDTASKQVVKTFPISGNGGIASASFSPDGTEFSVAVSDQMLNTSRIVIFRINPATGEIINQNSPEVYFTDSDMHPTSIDVANDDVQPIKDTDNDGITDENDGCPDDYNPEQVDKDNDGTQDACQTTPLDGYSDVYEFDGGSHVHTNGNVLVSTELGQVSMGEDGKANVIHSGNENLQITVGAWINFDIEVLEGEVMVPTQSGPQSVKKGDGKVPFPGNPEGILLALSGTDFVIETHDFTPPVEPNPEQNPEESPEQTEYAEPAPDVVEGGDFEVVEDSGPDGGDAGNDTGDDQGGIDAEGDDGTAPDTDHQDAGQDNGASDLGKDAGVDASGDAGNPDIGNTDTSVDTSEIGTDTASDQDTAINPESNNGGGKGCNCNMSPAETQQTVWGKIVALLGLSGAFAAMRRRRED